MRNESELRLAHDMLHAVIMGDVDPGLDGKTRDMFMANCDALCWALGCPNPTFGNNVALMKREFERRGVTVVDAGRPLTPEEWEAYQQ